MANAFGSVHHRTIACVQLPSEQRASPATGEVYWLRNPLDGDIAPKLQRLLSETRSVTCLALKTPEVGVVAVQMALARVASLEHLQQLL